MSRSSLIGAFALGRQSSKDLVAGALNYVPSTTVGLGINQPTTTIPPEVGGTYFLRGSYKPGVAGGGDQSFVARADTLGHFCFALCGQSVDTAVAGQPGAFQHALTPFAPGAGIDLPWYTLLKNTSQLHAEQHLNSKLRNFSVDIPKSSLVTAQSSWLATTPSTTAIPATPTFDITPTFQTCVATVSLTSETTGLTFSANSNRLERISIQYGNNISEDERSVGNFFLDDITLLQRTVGVNLDIIIRDNALYQAVYFNNLSLPNTWQPAIYRAALSVTVTSNAFVPGTTQVYSANFLFPGLDMMMMPIGLAGADLVRASLATQVTLGPSGADQFSITLINDLASY